MYDNVNSSPLVATFTTREAAHKAVDNLHDEGFHNTWIGLMKTPESGFGDSTAATQGAVVESANPIARFFGEGDESLHAALIKHGVSEADAARLDGTLPAGSAIVTVDGSNHPEMAAQIFAQCGGTMVGSTGSANLYDRYTEGTGSNFDSGKLSTLGSYHGGESVDEARLLKLREERLTIDKQREQTGEAVVSKKVTSQDVVVDVPVYHEELYIERRPASGSYGDVGTIGDGQTIRVPLEKETAIVGKQTVVTEEVAVGQRRVDGVDHVSETLQKEELDVRDGRLNPKV